MSSGLAFWGPFLVIFGTALIVSVVQRYARDICFMLVDSDHVLIQMRDGKWIWGCIEVHSKAIEITYPNPVPAGNGNEYLTYVLYEQNIADIVLLLRPEPAEGTPAHARWLREMQQLRHPPLWRRLKRDLRNLFNMLRNAFSESIALVVGIVKQRTAVGRIAGADQKATEAGQKLLTAIPASYEPILEHYRSHEVATESFKDPANVALGSIVRIGLLEEYSDKFILMRDVLLAEPLPAGALRSVDARDRFLVIVPRTSSFVRHLARRPEASPATVSAASPAT